jgi:phage terminase large subunit-like protein
MLSTIVIAVDPAVTNTENSDRTGIIVCGINALEEYFILEDMSGFYEPSEWARMVHFLYDKWQANFIVVEVNQGGSLLTSNLNAFTDGFKRKQYLNIKEVRAKYGKLIRAEPIQTLYAKNKVKHIHYFKDQQGDLLDLESEMLFFTGNGNEKSPDRLDSMVHGLTSFIQGQEVSRQDAFDNLFTENEYFDF